MNKFINYNASVLNIHKKKVINFMIIKKITVSLKPKKKVYGVD